jgi:Mg-chelatase subunit ChlD
MANSVRVARLKGDRFRAEGEADPLGQHATLVGLIKRYLPGVSGSVLAEPRRLADGGEVEWYSDLAGQPVPLTGLDEASQAQARGLLEDRIASIRELADRLPQIDPASAHLSDALRRAVSYPGDESVYVINGQPVLTFWGHVDPSRPPPPPVAAPAPARAFPWGWLGLLLVSLILAGLLVWWFMLREPSAPPPDYQAMLVEVMGDCERMAVLADRLAAPDVVAAPDLPAVREKLRRELEICSAPDYRRMLNEALGDCGRIAELATYLGRADLIETAELAVVRDVVTREVEVCQRPDYRQMLEDAGEDCRKLVVLYATLQSVDDPDHPDLPAVRRDLGNLLAECRMDQLRREFEAAKADCGQLKSFAGGLRASDTQLPGYADLKDAMTPLLAECNAPKPQPEPKPEPEPEPQPQPRAPSQADTMQQCPGERPKELAPDLVLVFDSSGSMRYPLLTEAEMQRRVMQAAPLAIFSPQLMEQLAERQFASMEKRVDVAKQATRRLVSGLPNDVDVGLVLVEKCRTAKKAGFYSPAERGNLLRRISSISPNKGTPLASGIAVAGTMVDGVEVPALMVIITDGKESCDGDPCAVARQLARAKPKLQINVVDILGTGAGNCVARATGGKVWSANNAGELASMLDRAANAVKGPAHCQNN